MVGSPETSGTAVRTVLPWAVIVVSVTLRLKSVIALSPELMTQEPMQMLVTNEMTIIRIFDRCLMLIGFTP